MNIDPERQRRLRALAELHDRWQAEHRVDDADFTPEGADSANRRPPSPEAEREYMRRAREIMGLDPDTGHYRETVMLLPAVRSRDEADLYLELHPCPRCGAMEAAWDEAPVLQGTRPAYRYTGRCADCGDQREFVFALPEGQASPADPGSHPTTRFGGPQPSALLDPGEWLLVADWCAEAAEVAERQGDNAEAAELRWTAVAAIEEIRKFLPAEGNLVPESAFWSPRGRAVYQRDPGRFRRRRLEVIRDFHLEHLPQSPS